ncbi:MAG TPA: hypothetical protein VJR92_08350 [Gemmatimonadaceae bacterium]|nr:hypothetical protein [Gemmatimonadaceae bacterium]
MTQQPHLAPEDIDFLLDGDEGFGVFPLRKHVAACPECQARVDDAKAVARLIERLPHSAPSTGFADKVMARVNVFEPWYVTVADSVRQYIPRTGPLRVMFATGTGLAAFSITTLAVWVALRLDLAVYAAQLGWTRVQTAAMTTGGSAVSSLLGEPALNALRDGGLPAIALGTTGLFVVLVAATLGFRGLVRVARRRGN